MHSVDKSTGVRQKSIPYILAGMGKPYDIVDVQEECPNISNTCQVTAKQILWKKVFGNKVLNFGTKKFFKKILETKFYHFETLFSRTISGSKMILYKKVPGI